MPFHLGRGEAASTSYMPQWLSWARRGTAPTRAAAAVNAVYFPSWRVYKGMAPSTLQVAAITHVFYAFVGVHEDGRLRLLDEWADLGKPVDGQQGCLAALAALKRRNPHLRTLVSIGGAGASAEFPALAASERSRRVFASQIREFCERHGLDGVDVDWEHPTTPQQGRDFVELLGAVRRTLPSPHYLVTSALPVGEYCLRNIDLAKACRSLDLLNLMAYDFTGTWTQVCGHHAQLQAPGPARGALHQDLASSGRRGVDYARSRGVRCRNIVLGVPVYARFFSGAQGPGAAFEASGVGEIDYCELPGAWIAGARVDDAAAAASFVDVEGGKGFVSFDVPRTVAAKARYAKATGLAGLFYWTGAGDRPGDESLVLAGYTELVSGGA